MGLNKRLFASSAKCLAETADIFGDNSGIALYSLGYDASDASGNYNGSSSATVKFGQIGKVGYGANFNGANGSEVITTINNSVLPVNSSFSISFWIKYNALDTANSPVGMTNEASPYPGWAFYVTSTNLFQIAWNGGAPGFTTGSAYTVTLGEWFHATMTYDGSGTTKMYIDGSLQGTKTSHTINTPTAYLRIGDGDVWNTPPADINQVRVFNKELSSSEVTKIYNEVTCVHTGTTDDNAVGGTNVAYYKFDGDYTDEKGSYDGTAYAVAGFKFGRFGTAVDFTGTISRINTGYTKSGNEFGVSMWAYIKDTGARQIMLGDFNSGGADASGSISFGVYADDTFKVNIGNGSSVQNSISTSFSGYYDKWTHVAVSIASDGKTATLYLDDNKTVGTTVTNAIQNGQNPIGLGHYSATATAGNEFQGLMDQVRIFSSALSDDDVDALYAEKQEHIVLNSSDPFDDDECKLHLKLDNNSNDSVNSSNNGTDTNMLYSSSDKLFGTHSADFSTSGSKIIIPAIDLSAATISLWAKIPNVNGTYNLINKYSDDGTVREWNIYNYQTSNGFVPYNYYNNNNGNGPIVSAGNYLSNNKWHHIVLAINATTQPQLYFDGVLVKTATGTLGYSTGNPNIELGYSNSTYDFSGKIDQVRIFDRKLTGAEIFKLYAEATLN